MIGSETFIIVALRWTENSTPSVLARAICSVRKRLQRRDVHRRGVDDLAGQHRHGLPEHRGRAVRRRPARSGACRRAAITAEVSLDRKSSRVMWATLVLESGDQAPIECGWLRAYDFTEAGARRSELPSRRTGLTALPFTLS